MRLIVIDADWLRQQINFLHDRVTTIQHHSIKVAEEYDSEWRSHADTIERLHTAVLRSDDLEHAVQRRIGEAVLKGIEETGVKVEANLKGGV